MKDIKQFCEELTKDIQDAYESSPTLEQSEKLAAKFLDGQIQIGSALASADLNTRMRKSGLKAIKAAVYLDIVSNNEKKPSDVLIGAKVDSDAIVMAEQKAFDEAEVEKNQFENYLDVFKNAHIFFRGMSRGRFE